MNNVKNEILRKENNYKKGFFYFTGKLHYYNKLFNIFIG